MTPHIWTPEQKPVLPPGLRKPIFPGERGYEDAFRLAGLVNGGLVNDGHAMVNGGVIRAAVSGPPDPLAGYSFRWIASEGLYQDLAKTTPATADGDPVAVWTDEAGTRDLVNTAGTTRPTLKLNIINGKPVVRFDGSNDYLKYDFSGSPDARPYSSFIVGRVVSIGDLNYFFALGNGSPAILYRSATSKLTMFDGGNWGPAVANPDTNGHIYFGAWDRTTPRFRIDNGTADTSGSMSFMPDASIITLGANSTPSNYSQVDVAEFLLYPTLLDTTDEGTERDNLNSWYACF